MFRNLSWSSLITKDKKLHATRKVLVLPAYIIIAKITQRKQYGHKFKYISCLKCQSCHNTHPWVSNYLECNVNDVLMGCTVSSATNNFGSCIVKIAKDLKKKRLSCRMFALQIMNVHILNMPQFTIFDRQSATFEWATKICTKEDIISTVLLF